MFSLRCALGDVRYALSSLFLQFLHLCTSGSLLFDCLSSTIASANSRSPWKTIGFDLSVDCNLSATSASLWCNVGAYMLGYPQCVTISSSAKMTYLWCIYCLKIFQSWHWVSNFKSIYYIKYRYSHIGLLRFLAISWRLLPMRCWQIGA